ncbi:alpha-L-fucosidase [Vibrio sp. JPW-9-11-11]|uniref:alpha-L-fucosidase n=1 Tax=Vibrio sp. JPW-9-11-11 TaxID=1416532 RepID=UPI0015930A4D|nr:alpha-L-fucosidase [Vibrio sp. JPW-9-11-11]NVD05854.1 alpha-L-fucosidase [Vibrio sp. JPW-9-11-11]
MTVGELAGESSNTHDNDRDNFTGVSSEGLARWKSNTFGMFVHWGLYCHQNLAGFYQGKYYDIISEWLPYSAKIPMATYQDYARTFNPHKFNANALVEMAKQAGMNYLVITAKHHDGFAMYHSQVDDFNIHQQTPFARDPLKEIEQACRQQDLDLGFYYSHAIDWHHPTAYSLAPNNWDHQQDQWEQNGYQAYWQNKCLPQVKELLSDYGDLCSLWFDMGGFDIAPDAHHVEQVTQLMESIRDIQPHTVVNSRVTSDKLEHQVDWDIKTGHDNYMEPLPVKPYFWEGISTTNDNWGYSRSDLNPKSANSLINQLCCSVSRGGNFLLNVTLTPEGQVPIEMTEILSEMGQWMDINQSAVIDTEASPFSTGFNWGVVTHDPTQRTLYLILQRSPEHNQIQLHQLNNSVIAISELSGSLASQHLAVLQRNDDDDSMTTTITLHRECNFNQGPTVLKLQYEGELSLNHRVAQDRLHKVRLDALNVTTNHSESPVYHWTFTVNQPGRYCVDLASLESRHHKTPGWEHYGKTGSIACGDQTLDFSLNPDAILHNDTQIPWKTVVSELGELEFSQAGEYQLTLSGFNLGIDHYAKYGDQVVNLDYLLIRPRRASH